MDIDRAEKLRTYITHPINQCLTKKINKNIKSRVYSCIARPTLPNSNETWAISFSKVTESDLLTSHSGVHFYKQISLTRKNIWKEALLNPFTLYELQNFPFRLVVSLSKAVFRIYANFYFFCCLRHHHFIKKSSNKSLSDSGSKNLFYF